MKNSSIYLVFLLMGITLFSSCNLFNSDEEEEEEEPKSVIELINENADLSMLKEAIQRNSGLLNDLENIDSEFTIFAPSNQAFNEFIESVEDVNSLSDLDDEILSDFIKYHIISGTVLKLENMETGDSPATLLSEVINMLINGTSVILNDIAEIISADIEADNGIVHIINSVLLPSAYLPLENEFMYKGERYPLAWGFYNNYGMNSGYTNYDFIMTEVEEDLDEVEQTGEIESDYYIYLWLEFEGSTFTGGRFEYNENGFSEEPEKFLYGGSVWFRESDDEIEVKSGYVDVEISGDNYTIILNLTLENNETLTGQMTYPFEEQIPDEGGGGNGEVVNTGDDYQSDFNIYVDDIRFPVSHSNVIDYGDFDGSGYNIDIELFSRDPNSGDLTGAHYFYVELFSESTEKFIDGEYVYDNSYPAGENHFGYSVFNINVNQESQNALFINSGFVIISTSDNILDITFELTDEFDRIISGYYNGDLNISKYGQRSKASGNTKSKLRVKNNVFSKNIIKLK